MSVINDVKALLDISPIDTSRDALLQKIVSLTGARLQNLLGGVDEVPEELEYITTEVSIRRFNRIGSEGLSSHTVEGETMSWPDNDFAPYSDDIQAYLDTQKDAAGGKGKVRFI